MADENAALQSPLLADALNHLATRKRIAPVQSLADSLAHARSLRKGYAAWRPRPRSRCARWRIIGRLPCTTWSTRRMGSVSGAKGTERRMLSDAEAQRLRAAVQAAMVARRYDLARATLQELAQRSQGKGPSGAQRSASTMAPLLNFIIATGLMFGAAGLIEHQPRYAAAGAALIGPGLVEWLIVWLRRRRGALA